MGENESQIPRNTKRDPTTWEMFWSAPNHLPFPVEQLDSKHPNRAEVLWLLERWLDNIVEYRKDHWKYAYTTLILLVAICFTLITNPIWLQPLHGIFGAGLAVTLFCIWAVAHYSTNEGLRNARRGKNIAYDLLGDPMTVARQPTTAEFIQIPQMLIVAVASATGVTVLASIYVAVGGGAADQTARRVGELVERGHCASAEKVALRQGRLDLAENVQALCATPKPKPPTTR